MSTVTTIPHEIASIPAVAEHLREVEAARLADRQQKRVEIGRLNAELLAINRTHAKAAAAADGEITKAKGALEAAQRRRVEIEQEHYRQVHPREHRREQIVFALRAELRDHPQIVEAEQRLRAADESLRRETASGGYSHFDTGYMDDASRRQIGERAKAEADARDRQRRAITVALKELDDLREAALSATDMASTINSILNRAGVRP